TNHGVRIPDYAVFNGTLYLLAGEINEQVPVGYGPEAGGWKPIDRVIGIFSCPLNSNSVIVPHCVGLRRLSATSANLDIYEIVSTNAFAAIVSNEFQVISVGPKSVVEASEPDFGHLIFSAGRTIFASVGKTP